MTRLDSIWECARADLVFATEHGGHNQLLWEHSRRVACSVQKIVRFPEVLADSPDEQAAIAAALYHDAGWLFRKEDEELSHADILIQPLDKAYREQGITLMFDRLEGLLPGDSLDRAGHAIRTLNDPHNETVEGRVVSEAENVSEVGILSLWTTIRRGAAEGKGVQAIIDTWHRRKEYQFWSAWLNDSFRYESVRRIAAQRLEQYERLMEELEEHHNGSDIEPAPSSTPEKRFETMHS